MEIMRDRSTSVNGPSSLDDDFGADDVLFSLWLTSRTAKRVLDAVLRATDLDSDEFAIYSVLGSTTGGITPSELARWMAAPATTVSSYIKRFDGRGHIRRTSDPADGRAYRLSLTPAGRKAHQRAVDLFLPALDDLRRQLDRGEPAVRQALVALRRALDGEQGRAGA